MAALLALGIAARSVLWRSYGLESSGRIDGYSAHIYYATLCRFDEFLPGVAVAMLKNCHPMGWERITRHGQRALGLGTVLTDGMLCLVHRDYCIDGYGYRFFMTAFGYSLLAMAFAVLVVAALSPASWLHRIRVPGALQLATWAYAIYLSHKAIAHVLKGRPTHWACPRPPRRSSSRRCAWRRARCSAGGSKRPSWGGATNGFRPQGCRPVRRARPRCRTLRRPAPAAAPRPAASPSRCRGPSPTWPSRRRCCPA